MQYSKNDRYITSYICSNMKDYIDQLQTYPLFPLTKQSLDMDRVRGMFLAGALGDALGAPHEFKTVKYSYTGKLEHKTILSSRFGYRAELAIGQVTDDTEMCMVILDSVLANQGYAWLDVLKNYIEWANSDSRWIGINTREVFKGIKTTRGYFSRQEKKINEGGLSQSNGTLMRIGPLLLFDTYYPCISDCLLSNFNSTSVNSSLVFYTAARMIFTNQPLDKIYETCLNIMSDVNIKKAIDDAYKGIDRDISGKDKGWCVHAIWCSFYCLFNKLDMDAMYAFVIGKGGDTDTNAAITGYLLGARDGEKKMRSSVQLNYNLDVLLAAADKDGYKATEYPRNVKYTLYNFDKRMKQLETLLIG